MTQFQSQQQAKEYLVDRIVAEAARVGIPLSEIERKMLYFSETDWAPPGVLEAAAEFDREYDNDEYEEKITHLIQMVLVNASDTEKGQWDDAVLKLSEGDHYLLVMVDSAYLRPACSSRIAKLAPWLPSDSGAIRLPGDRRRLILIALAILAILMIGFAVAAALR